MPERFAYLSAASDIERVLEKHRVFSDSGTLQAISQSELLARLTGGEIAIVAGGELTGDHGLTPITDDEFIAHRQDLRADATVMRYLLRQFALDEVSSYQGASKELMNRITMGWRKDLAILIDVAMTVSLGADRQRYTDLSYVSRFNQRGPAAYRRLELVGVRSNPLLVVD